MSHPHSPFPPTYPPKGVASKLISYSTMPKNGAYYYEYVIQPDNQPRRHLTTVLM